MTYLGKPVKDLVRVNYGFLPLPYHHASWIPHRLLPYIIDKCLAANNVNCKYKEYVNYTLETRDEFLYFTNTTYDALTSWWIGKVNSKFGWSYQDMIQVYNRSAVDAHNSEARARYMWKYAADQGVFATPTAFVNGVRVQNTPFTPQDWYKLLQDVYNSQKVSSI